MVQGAAFERFEVWFGSLFLGIGLLALMVAGCLALALVRNRQAWPRRWAFLAAPLGIGLIFSTFGAGTAGYGLWQHGEEQRILAVGVSGRATVTEVVQSMTRVNGRYLWRVRYQYTLGAGQTYTGESGLLPADEARAWRPGDTAFVRYDPAQPHRSIWLGRADRVAAERRSP
ncbi:MAG: DUF3592 domain-containing protein [Chloroflexi bacterium]|nr:DUF3592 domain-containing protein [Chloroflexota bacterium]